METNDKALVFAVPVDERLGKVVVRVNCNQTGRFDAARERIGSNVVRTGGLIDLHNIEEPCTVKLTK